MATNNIISFGSSGKSMTSEKSSFNGKALKSCRPIIANSLPNCFVFLNDLDDILFKLADKAESNQQQEEYFVAMRQFRINQEKLKKDFTQLVLDDFDAFCSPSSSANNKSSGKDSTSSANLELSILDNESLEEDIAVNRIAMKSESLFGHDMSNLGQRFANALNIKKVDNNPLNPERIAGHIKDVIAPLSSNIEIKLVAYKQFEKHAVAELAKLCAQLNDNLIKLGVLPNLEKKKPKIGNTNQTVSNTINKMADLDLNDYIGGEQPELVDPSQFFEGLRQFLNKPQGNQPSYGGRAAPIAEHSTVLSALSSLQQLPTSQLSFDADGSAHLPDVRQILMNSLLVTQADGTQVQQTVSRLDEDAMDLIDLLFEFILDDQSIPAPIRAVLARLQIPLLKIALSDKDVFSKKSHPARRLLNNLAKSSTGWSEQSTQQDKLQAKIESIVDTILLEFETNVQLFLDLNTQFNEFISQLNKSSKAAEQRIVQANEGQEKLIAAQQQVDNVINQQLSQHKYLPKVVIALIEDGWKHVLKLRLLQKGKDSDEWRSSIELIQQLLWSVSPKPDEDDRKKLLEVIPGMLKSLREGLSGASFNQHKITALFKDLQQCHIQCMNGSMIADNELQSIDQLPLAAATKPDLETLPSLDEKKKVISDNLAMQKAKQLSVGTWLEIASDDGKTPQRIKFSWRSNLTGRCLFVTYQGTKAAEIAITELASWFQQGKILVIDQSTQLMDRALASMMETVDS
ncbi:MAG: hypothetical protein COA83_11430 [Methylophaga sp.]|nr:MAG: hypothetical protein COA83_11430 [Methylophaga sp.]